MLSECNQVIRRMQEDIAKNKIATLNHNNEVLQIPNNLTKEEKQ